MSIERSAERAIDILLDELADTDDPDERKAIIDEIRRIEREVSDYLRWREEGDDRGW